MANLLVERAVCDNYPTISWHFGEKVGTAAMSLKRGGEPQPSAPTEAWRSWIWDLICAGQFTVRLFSWVCVREHYFLKIPRVHGAIQVDFNEGNLEADHEHRLIRRLTELDGMIDAPVRLIGRCIVKHRFDWTGSLEIGRAGRRHITGPRLDEAIRGPRSTRDFRWVMRVVARAYRRWFFRQVR